MLELLTQDLATPSLPGIITAVAAVITALSLLVASFSVLLPTLRAARRTEAVVKVTHDLVNHQHDELLLTIQDLLRYQRALVLALNAGGVDVPYDQSKPPPPAPLEKP